MKSNVVECGIFDQWKMLVVMVLVHHLKIWDGVVTLGTFISLSCLALGV